MKNKVYLASDSWRGPVRSPAAPAAFFALHLKDTLEEYGIPQVLETVDGKRRIVTDQVECDLYQYLSGKEEYGQLFKGSYLSNYSWGEVTLGELNLGVNE